MHKNIPSIASTDFSYISRIESMSTLDGIGVDSG